MKASLPCISYGYFLQICELIAPLTFPLQSLSSCLAYSNVLFVIGFPVDAMLDR